MGTLNKRCVIIGGGDCSVDILKNNILSDDFIICADSGYDIANDADIVPDLLIGDFDSIKRIPDNVNKITLPVEKDVTDCLAAYNEGIKLGFKAFAVFGGTGGRFEHTFANISLLAAASQSGVSVEMIDDIHIFRSISNDSIKINRKDNQQISIFAYGSDAIGVTLKGFHYSLFDFTLDPFYGSLGTSNDIIDEYGEIIVENGTLIIVETHV